MALNWSTTTMLFMAYSKMVDIKHNVSKFQIYCKAVLI